MECDFIFSLKISNFAAYLGLFISLLSSSLYLVEWKIVKRKVLKKV